MRAALSRHDALMREAVEEAGGKVFKTTGDGLLAAFPHPPEAATAALAAQRTLAGEPWGATGPLRVRMAALFVERSSFSLRIRSLSEPRAMGRQRGRCPVSDQAR